MSKRTIKSVLFLELFVVICVSFTQMVFISCQEIDQRDKIQINCSEDFDVTLIYNRSELCLNISNLNEDHSDITVINENNKADAFYAPLEGHNFFTIPHMEKHAFIIQPGDNYAIIIDNKTTFSCHIPDCFKRCKCSLANITNFNISLINDNALNISWSFTSFSEIPTNITHLHLSLSPNYEDIFNETNANYFVYPLELEMDLTYSFDLTITTNHSCYYKTTAKYNYISNKLKFPYTSYLTLFFVVITIILLIVLYFCIPKLPMFTNKIRNLLMIRRPNQNSVIWHMNYNYTTQEPLNVDNRYEIDRSKIEMIQPLKPGAFGEVFFAKLTNEYCNDLRVAVKRPILNSPEVMDDFISEINMLKLLNTHVNVVKLIGHTIKTKPYLMIMEFVACGDLESYLIGLREEWKNRSNRNKFEGTYVYNNVSVPTTPTTPCSNMSNTDTVITLLNSEPTTPTTPLTSKLSNYMQMEPVLDNRELQNFALQIARGMLHVESLNITHRDLAARNVLISEKKVLKISDFGMARVSPYYNLKTTKIPIRWCAIESIVDGLCDSKSDVWSYGVVLWEIGTLAAKPYYNIPNEELPRKIVNGLRLDKPTTCTDELYDLMLNCWQVNRTERPSFKDIVSKLSNNSKKIYVEFSVLNPTYIFPPHEK